MADEDNPDIALTVQMATDSAQKDKLLEGYPLEKLYPLVKALLVPEMRPYFAQLEKLEPDAPWTEFDNECASVLDWRIDNSTGELGLRLSEAAEDRPPATGRTPYYSSWAASRIIGKHLFPQAAQAKSTYVVSYDEASCQTLVRCIRHLAKNDPGELLWLLVTCDVPAKLVADYLKKPLPQV